MTQVNREREFLHYVDLMNNYKPIPEKNKGLLSVSKVKANAKEQVENRLKQWPELAELMPKKEAPLKEKKSGKKR